MPTTSKVNIARWIDLIAAQVVVTTIKTSKVFKRAAAKSYKGSLALEENKRAEVIMQVDQRLSITRFQNPILE